MPSFGKIVLAGLCTSVLSIPDARSEVDQSPKPGGVYLLKPGIFVAEGERCQEPANYTIRRYDGKGISTAHTSACTARVVAKRRSGYGYVYEVRQSCLDTGAGTGERFIEQQTIDIPDALTFTIKSESGTTYRYCPINELPTWLRKWR